MRMMLIAALLAAAVLAAGCHHTGRQVRKTVDGVHDVFLEGAN